MLLKALCQRRSLSRKSFVPRLLASLEARALLSAGLACIGHTVSAEVRHHHRAGGHERPTYPVGGAVHVVRNVVYRDVPGDRQALDLIVPDGPVPAGGRPVVVAIHGGGWRKFSKEEYEPIVSPLAKLGYLVVVPNYRLSAPGSPSWPTNFEDVRDSVRWVRSHASEIGADPNRIAAMGESAGGHLAALLGTYPDGPIHADGPPTGAVADGSVSARVQAVVDFYGPTDLTALDAQSRDAAGAIRQFLGAIPKDAPGRFLAASPTAHVTPDDPPFLIVQGAADTLVLPSQSRTLSDRLTAAGVPNRLIVIPSQPHGFGLDAGGKDLLGTIGRFLSDAMAPHP
jgi:acetyl esterase/lipase